MQYSIAAHWLAGAGVLLYGKIVRALGLKAD